jgi:hypothetical protein
VSLLPGEPTFSRWINAAAYTVLPPSLFNSDWNPLNIPPKTLQPFYMLNMIFLRTSLML